MGVGGTYGAVTHLPQVLGAADGELSAVAADAGGGAREAVAALGGKGSVRASQGKCSRRPRSESTYT